MNASLIVAIGIVVMVVITLFNIARIVPQKSAFIVERLGKYRKTLEAGLHFLLPFIDKISYRHSLKEMALDVPEQTCITKDNIAVDVDGVLYLQVIDPVKASYGIADFMFASSQLAQTTMRSEIGKIDLDKTFEEREKINSSIITAVDKASDPWGVKITRYEIKNITPPKSVKDALEKQMRAEREKRAEIAQSEGHRQALINVAEGERQQNIALSEGEMQKRINEAEGERQKRIKEAEGRAKEIELVADATAKGLKAIALVINEKGGADAVNLRVAEQYIGEFGKLAKENNTIILPGDLTDIAGIVATAKALLKDPGGSISISSE